MTTPTAFDWLPPRLWTPEKILAVLLSQGIGVRVEGAELVLRDPRRTGLLSPASLDLVLRPRKLELMALVRSIAEYRTIVRRFIELEEADDLSFAECQSLLDQHTRLTDELGETLALLVWEQEFQRAA